MNSKTTSCLFALTLTLMSIALLLLAFCDKKNSGNAIIIVSDRAEQDIYGIALYYRRIQLLKHSRHQGDGRIWPTLSVAHQVISFMLLPI